MGDNVLRGIVQITAPGVQQAFNSVSDGVKKTENSLKGLKGSVESTSLTLRDQKNILKSLQQQFGALSTEQARGTFGKELQADIRIANSEIKRLEGAAVPAFGSIGQAATKGFSAVRQLAYILPGIGIAGIFTAAFAGLELLADKIFSVSKQSEEAKKRAEELSKSIDSVFGSVAKEATEVTSLIAVLKSETETRERRLGAIKELQSIQPEIFKGLKLEGDAVVGLDAAYTAYLANLKNVIDAKIIQARLEQKIEQLLRLQGAAATDTEKGLLKAAESIKKRTLALAETGTTGGKTQLEKRFNDEAKASKESVDSIQRDIDGLFRDLETFERAIDVKPPPKIPKVKLEKPLKKLELPIDVIPEFAFETGFVKREFEGKFKDLTKELLDNSDLGKGIKFNIQLNPQLLELQASQARIIAAAQTLADSFNDTLQQGFTDAFAALGQGIGNLLSGKDFGDQLFQVFGSLLEAIGKALIKFGIVKAGIDKILANPLIPGGVALGLGIFAIAAGALIKNLKGARALGGPVSAGGTYLVGERGPELFKPNTGGQIIPNNQLGTGRNVSGGGMVVQVAGQFVQRGQDLLAVITLANQSKSRLQ